MEVKKDKAKLPKWANRYSAIGMLSLIILVALAVYNLQTDCSNFWKTSFSSCLTIGVAVFLSCIFAQKTSDNRKQKAVIEDAIISLQKLLLDPASYDFRDCVDTRAITMRKRDLSNRIDFLRQHGAQFGMDSSLQQIETLFREYEDLIGNHFSDLKYLAKSQLELQRPLSLIDNELYNIRIGLYT